MAGNRPKRSAKLRREDSALDCKSSSHAVESSSNPYTLRNLAVMQALQGDFEVRYNILINLFIYRE